MIQKLCGSLRDRLDAGRRRALGAGLGLILDLRALLERAVAVALDRAEVNEHVVRAVVGCDEPVALVVAEPLNGSGRHIASSYVCAANAEDAICNNASATHNFLRRITRPYSRD